MPKNQSEIEQIVCDALRKFAGKDGELGLQDQPISGWGLTSMEGCEFVAVLEEQLDCEIGRKENAFKDDAGNERSVRQIIDYAMSHCTRTGVPTK